MMKRIMISTLAIIAFAYLPVSATIINVPYDYETIQEGIDACTAGDTVMVSSGTYIENLNIPMTVSVIGEERDNTVVDGSGEGDVIFIEADGVVLKSLTIRNGGVGIEDAGIEISFSDNCLVELCRLVDSYAGLYLYGSSYNSVKRCYIESNGCGIYFYESPSGPYVDNASNLIENNVIQSNTYFGILFEHMIAYHASNQIRGNRIVDNNLGFFMIMSQENEVLRNDFITNTGYGISHAVCIGGGELNRYHHNNFLYNNGGSIQAANNGFGTDYWYSQEDEEGNYWSDYSGPDNDGDGIGDVPYDVDGDACQDLYPLMEHLPAAVEGTVTNGGGGPVENAHLVALGTEIDDYSDVDGHYALPEIGAGAYDILCSHDEYEDLHIPGVPVTTGQITILDLVMRSGDCDYMPGDCDHNHVPLELSDVVEMIGMYRGTTDPEYTCACPPHGDDFAPEADPSGNCVAFELGDVVTEIGAYRGTAEASGCVDCPGTLRLMPDSPDEQTVMPRLKSKTTVTEKSTSE
jgi:nitrous oxidase accessory protein